MEGSFVSLLNEGSFTEFEDMVFSEPTQSQSQPPSQPQPQSQKEAPKQKKGKRSKNFLIEEDMLLISAWLNISMDPVQGTNQTHTCYWNRILNYYEGNKEGLESDRSANSLCNRWCTINEKVAKFIGFFNHIFGRNQSGLTEQDKLKKVGYRLTVDSQVKHHVCNLTSEKLPSNYSRNNWGFTRCAKELFQSGFQIICGHSRTIVDIKFNERKISIPQVIIDNSSDTVFRNLIAFEQTSIGRHAITSYVKLMSTLIHSREDAYLLEQVGIIIKSDEVEDVSAFFKSLCREVVFIEFCFTDLCKEVESYQIPLWRWRKVKGYFSIKFFEWKESIKDLKMHYLRSRWSFIGFLAASFVIILTLVQTFYTMRAYYPPYH